jgi:hypothetical protein
MWGYGSAIVSILHSNPLFVFFWVLVSPGWVGSGLAGLLSVHLEELSEKVVLSFELLC